MTWSLVEAFHAAFYPFPPLLGVHHLVGSYFLSIVCTHVHIYLNIYRICTSCSERKANVLADVHNICLTYTPAHAWCSTTPVNAFILSAKDAYGLVHAPLYNGAAASAWKLLRTYLESCTNIAQAVVCHPPSCRLDLARPPPSLDAVRSRNPFKSTLAHDAVAPAVLHKHHLIIRDGTGLIQFVYGSRSHLTTRRLPVTEMHFRHFRASFIIQHKI